MSLGLVTLHYPVLEHAEGLAGGCRQVIDAASTRPGLLCAEIRGAPDRDAVVITGALVEGAARFREEDGEFKWSSGLVGSSRCSEPRTRFSR